MPPVSLLRAKDDAAKYGLDPEVVLQLKEKAMRARGVAYCMLGSFFLSLLSKFPFCFFDDVGNGEEVGV